MPRDFARRGAGFAAEALFDAGFAVILKTQQHRGLSAGVLGGSADLVPKREQKAQELKAAMTALDAAIASEATGAPLSAAAFKAHLESRYLQA